jgi:glucans biosynthesis protein C
VPVIAIFGLMGIGASLGSSEHDWFEFAWFLACFMIGFVLLSDERFTAAVRRDLWPAAGVASISTTLIVAGSPAPLDSASDQGFGSTFLALGFLFAAQGWTLTLIVLNIGMRAARLQRPVSAHLSDAVLPVYVIHQPVILAVAFFVVQWPLAILPKWLVVFGVSLAITLALVELALNTPATRALLGARIGRNLTAAREFYASHPTLLFRRLQLPPPDIETLLGPPRVVRRGVTACSPV